ncbi:hypothetical protein B0H14DRAFT_2658526 [Mycena olivaceomarginata]|nr:hypothetical protein B0H14DRAFT_2658526 [Mycena olivaceomarginata]
MGGGGWSARQQRAAGACAAPGEHPKKTIGVGHRNEPAQRGCTGTRCAAGAERHPLGRRNSSGRQGTGGRNNQHKPGQLAQGQRNGGGRRSAGGRNKRRSERRGGTSNSGTGGEERREGRGARNHYRAVPLRIGSITIEASPTAKLVLDKKTHLPQSRRASPEARHQGPSHTYVRQLFVFPYSVVLRVVELARGLARRLRCGCGAHGEARRGASWQWRREARTVHLLLVCRPLSFRARTSVRSGTNNALLAYLIRDSKDSSEYLAKCDERRAFISGFNGSAGCAVITAEQAFLFTDGRYFLQVEQQLDKDFRTSPLGRSLYKGLLRDYTDGSKSQWGKNYYIIAGPSVMLLLTSILSYLSAVEGDYPSAKGPAVDLHIGFLLGVLTNIVLVGPTAGRIFHTRRTARMTVATG